MDTPLEFPFGILGFILLVIGVIIELVGIIGFGWGHPKWYVSLYAVICGVWQFFIGGAVILYRPQDPMELIEFSICFIPPLIPLWYLRRKGEALRRKNEEEKKVYAPKDTLKKVLDKIIKAFTGGAA